MRTVYGANAVGLARRQADELERLMIQLEDKLNRQETDIITLKQRVKTIEDLKVVE